MNFAEIKNIEDDNQVETYKKMELALERGLGSWVWTSAGDKYLDLYGGHAVCSIGHSHPKVVNAINKQSAKMLFYSNLVYSDIRARAAEKLVSIAPESFTKVFFGNSGTEANENAMRMARFATGRENIISFSGGFHGRTADSISATFLGKYREIGKPNVPGHIQAEFGDIESLKELADSNTAGIIIEPIQSMAGIRETTPEFFLDLRKLCDKLGIVLIFDEVQTGIGRTGNWFFAGSENGGFVEPDIITLAKALGSGIPVGACLVNNRISAKVRLNDLGTTFGGGMLAMAAVLATLEAIETDEMCANAKAVENYLRRGLEPIASVKNVRGKGCLLGIEFFDGAANVYQSLLEKRIITGTASDPNILRLLPPINLTLEECDHFLRSLQND